MNLKMCRTQIVLPLLLALYVGLAHSWDIAVSFGDELKFYTHKTLISTIKLESRSLTALAYDDVHNMILYVDRQPNGDAICGYTLTSVENRCFTERTGRNIHGIAFDSVTDTVFFTDTVERTVNSFSLKPGSQNNARGNLLIKMDEWIPRDIILDSCKRQIYWLNTELGRAQIERARLTGTGREVFQTINSLYINSTYQMEPHSLTIDPQTQTIYWFEAWNETDFRVYSLSTLKKTEKFFVFHTPLDQNPVFTHPPNTLAITNTLIFVVDFRYTGANVYISTKKLPFSVVTEKIVHNGANAMIPVGIVANYQITEQNQNCEIF